MCVVEFHNSLIQIVYQFHKQVPFIKKTGISSVEEFATTFMYLDPYTRIEDGRTHLNGDRFVTPTQHSTRFYMSSS